MRADESIIRLCFEIEGAEPIFFLDDQKIRPIFDIAYLLHVYDVCFCASYLNQLLIFKVDFYKVFILTANYYSRVDFLNSSDLLIIQISPK